MDLSAFSDGQVRSKVWLCEHLEPYLNPNHKITILGSWYNLIGFILNVRKPNYYQSIIGYDVDKSVKSIADSINMSWVWGTNSTLQNLTANVNDVDLNNFDVIISTSVEHIESDQWYDGISKNKLICLQSSNVINDDPIWDIKNPNPNFEIFKSKYPMSQIHYEGYKVFDYGHLTYTRYMIIGIK